MSEPINLKVTVSKGSGFYVRAARNFLQGSKDKASVDSITISGLGNAISTAVIVASRLEQDSIGKVTKVSTAYKMIDDSETNKSKSSVAQVVIAMVKADAAESGEEQMPHIGGAELFRGQKGLSVWEQYEKERILGTGAFGTVYKGRHKSMGTFFAIKQLAKGEGGISMAEAMAEFEMCARVSHPHIMRVYGYFESETAISLVSELASGGELNDYMAKHPESNNERCVANVASQVLSALVFLHESSPCMIHHDIKPPNILIAGPNWSRDPTGLTPKCFIGDFGTCQMRKQMTGLASHLSNGTTGEPELLGTPEYCGPEVFDGNSGPRTDVYALGVSLFEILGGNKPFEIEYDIFGDGDTDTFAQMKDMNLEADFSPLKHVTTEGVNLLRRMLSKDFLSRPTARMCTEDEWFARSASEAGYYTPGVKPTISEEESAERAKRMQLRAGMSFFGKALLNMMAARLADETLMREKVLFMRADGDGDGRLTVEELNGIFAKNPSWDVAKVKAVMNKIDLDGDCSIEFNEWIAATMDLNTITSKAAKEQVHAFFQELDGNGDGKIQLAELRSHFGQLDDKQEAAFSNFFNQLDADGTGFIDKSEFDDWIKRVR